MLLQAERVDIATIALWLGHESIKTTYIYQHADNQLKQEAIDRTATDRHPTRPIPATRQPPRLPRITDDYAQQPTTTTCRSAGKTSFSRPPLTIIASRA